jgi:F-type H+-transporting ATPase subunit epsilon
MASGKSFQCSVVTPDQVVVECEARFVALPAHDGEMGVLAQRAAMLTRLDVGSLRIEMADGGHESLFIDGGFAEMVANRLTVLTEGAVRTDELTREGAEALLAESREVEGYDETAYNTRQRTARKARAQLRLLS